MTVYPTTPFERAVDHAIARENAYHTEVWRYLDQLRRGLRPAEPVDANGKGALREAEWRMADEYADMPPYRQAAYRRRARFDPAKLAGARRMAAAREGR